MSGLGYHIREWPCLQAFGVVTKELDQQPVDGVIVVVGVEIVEVKVDVDEGGGLLVGSVEAWTMWRGKWGLGKAYFFV